jgi:hypothetical protein
MKKMRKTRNFITSELSTINKILTGFDRVFPLYLKLSEAKQKCFLFHFDFAFANIDRSIICWSNPVSSLKTENFMKVEKIFKKIKHFDFAHEKKRKRSRSEKARLVNKIQKKRDAHIHRYGPEYRPPPLSQVSQRNCEKISTAPERTPLAFCVKCNCDVPMKWKARDKRGKKVDDWFVCAVCGSDCLEIKYSHK